MKLDPDQQAIAEAARECPDVFAEWLGFSQSGLHSAMQAHLSKHGDAAIGMPRGHGKSVQLGIRQAWEIGRNPSIRIKHIGQTVAKAQEQIRMVVQIMRSEVYGIVFPDIKMVKPDPSTDGSNEIVVKSPSMHRDATMQAANIFGRAGGRADLLCGDDVCDLRNSILVPAERAKVKEAWRNNWLPMRDFSAGRPRTWRLFTPYHNDDLTADWKRAAEQDGSLFWKPCRGFESPWGEVFTPEVLESQRREMGPLGYARAYELIPISQDSLIFRPEWIEAGFYANDPSEYAQNNGRVVAAIDWAFTEKRDESGDYSVCVIALIDKDANCWVLECLRVQATFPDFMRRAVDACERLGVSQILAEGNGPQAGLCQQLAQSTRIPVLKIARTKDKVTRASEAQPMVEQGRLRLRCRADGRLEPSQEPIRDEMVAFPAGEHDDTVDAVVDLLQHGRTRRYDPQAKPTTVASNRPKLWRLYGS
jgi:predicted phage terminase large subunit-like protein